MSDEYFYGVTLTGAAPTQTWDPFHGEDDQDMAVSNKLLVKMLLLGHDAPADEYNVVEVTTQTIDDVIKIPIGVLKVGEIRNICMELEFVAPVIFTLIKGAGPVHIHGHHLIGESSMEGTWAGEGEEEEEDEDGAEEDEDSGSARRKQKFPKTITKPGGVARKRK